MTDQKLKTVCGLIDSWCKEHGVRYDIACDETDLQGILVFRKDRPQVAKLLEFLAPQLDGVHLIRQKVRNGDILALSLKALSESRLARLVSDYGEQMLQPTMSERLSDVFYGRYMPDATETTQRDVKADLLAAAQRLAEAQYKQPTTSAGRNSGNRQPMRMDPRIAKSTPTKVIRRKKKPTQVESAKLWKPRWSRFGDALAEALGGMATSTDQQPTELFQKFARAMQVLGQTLGIGPLQDQLRKQGIHWKPSADGMSVVLFVQNAETSAPQPIARISSATLEKPNEFESQLRSILDFAKGQAPGTEQQRYEELQNMQKAVRDIARSVAPAEGPAAQAMQGQQAGAQQPAPQPVQQQPVQQRAQPAHRPQQPQSRPMQAI